MDATMSMGMFCWGTKILTYVLKKAALYASITYLKWLRWYKEQYLYISICNLTLIA